MRYQKGSCQLPVFHSVLPTLASLRHMCKVSVSGIRVLNHCSAEAWDVTSKHRGFTFIASQSRVDRQGVLGVSRIKSGQWPKVEIAGIHGSGDRFLQLQGA